MNLQDFKIKSKVVKLRWILELLKDDYPAWKAYLQELVNIDLKLLPFINIESKDISVRNEFYDELVKTWASVHFSEPVGIDDIMSQVIWYNSHIKIEGKPYCNKKWYNGNIKYVNDIVISGGKRFKTIDELQNDYNIPISVMDLNQIKHAMPLKWKKTIREVVGNTNNCLEYIRINGTQFHLSSIRTRDLYALLKDKIALRPTSENKWSELYEIEEDEWSDIYLRSAQLTHNTKIVQMQYKLLMRIIDCNKWLFKCKKTETENCRCGKLDDIEHFFIECDQVKCLWHQMFRWWKDIVDTTFNFSNKEIIFGVDNVFNLEVIMYTNYLILIVKYYIYISKIKEEELCFLKAISLLKAELTNEEEIAKHLNRYGKFHQAWGNLVQNL